MIRSTRALLAKELSANLGTIVALAVFSAVFCALRFVFVEMTSHSLSRLEIVSFFALPGLVFVAGLLAQGLVASEYYGRTQRFVEALPISASHALCVKYFFGLAVLLLIGGAVFSASVFLASSREPLTATFVAIMAARLGAYTLALWSVVFTFSLLGRWRIPLIAVIALLIGALDAYTSFELAFYGPLALVSPAFFPFERAVWPMAEIYQALLLAAAMVSLALILVHAREGSVVESLAKPMSSLERTFLVALAIVFIGVLEHFPVEEEVPTVATTAHAVVASDLADVKVTYIEDRFAADAGAHLSYLEERIAALGELLGESASTLSVETVLSPDLKPEEVRILRSEFESGVSLRANFKRTKTWSDAVVGMNAVHSLLVSRSAGRVVTEPNHWLLDGFAAWWARRGEHLIEAMDRNVDPLLLHALYASERVSLSMETLRRWDSTMVALGDYGAASLGYSVWRVLAQTHGMNTALELAKDEYSHIGHDDIRGWWADWREPVASRFADSTGVSFAAFVETWRVELEKLKSVTAYANALTKLPRGDLRVISAKNSEGTGELRFAMLFHSPLPEDSECYALHINVPPYPILISPMQMREESIELPGSEPLQLEHSVAGRYGHNTRVSGALECWVEAFGGRARLGAATLVMP